MQHNFRSSRGAGFGLGGGGVRGALLAGASVAALGVMVAAGPAGAATITVPPDQNVVLGGNDGDTYVGAASGTGTVTFSTTLTSPAPTAGSITQNSGGAAAIISVVIGSTGHSGTIKFSTANVYSGGTTIQNSATLEVAAAGALGSGAVTLNGGTLLVDNTVSSLANTITAAAGSTLNTFETANNNTLTVNGLAVVASSTLTIGAGDAGTLNSRTVRSPMTGRYPTP